MPARPVAGLGRRAPQSPSFGGTATANPLPVASTAGSGIIDPSNSNGAIPSFPTSTTTTTTTTESSTPAPSSSETATQSATRSTGPSTGVIIGVAAGGVALIALIIILFVYRSRQSKKEAQRRRAAANRDQWKVLDGGSGKGAGAGYTNDSYHPSPEWERKASLSQDPAPPSLPMVAHAAPGDQSFLTMKSNQSLPEARVADPPPAARPSTEYAASYLRSIYSAYDAQSITSNATSTRRSLRKSKSARELIAMQNLIEALDLSAEEAKARQRSNSLTSGQPGISQPTPDFRLPPPAVFRAALGGSEWDR